MPDFDVPRLAGRVLFALSCLALGSAPSSRALSMDEAIDLALKNSPELHAEERGRNAARQAVAQARGAFLPRVDFSLYYEDGRNALEFPEFGPAGPTGRSALLRSDIVSPFRTRFAVSVPLFTGGELASRLGQARASLRSVERRVSRQRQAAVFRVREAYLAVLRASDLVTASTSAVERSREVYRTAYRMLEAGLRSKADLLRADVAMASAERGFLLSTNGLELARSAFNHAIGAPLDAPVELDSLATDPRDLDGPVDEAIARALSSRPDLLALREQVDALGMAARAARGAVLPGLSLGGSYTVVDDRPGLGRDRASWLAGGALTWTIFNGGVNLGRYREAREVREQADRTAEALQRRIALEVKESYLGVREAFDRTGLADRQLGSARESYRVIERAYREGLSSQADMLEVQASLTAAETEAAAARYDLLIARARLTFAVGAE